MDYLPTLAKIDSELHDIDIKNMKFLCQPSIQRKYFSMITSGLSVFEALEKSGLLSPTDLSYLWELLMIIGRVDLAYELNCDDIYVDADPETLVVRKVSPFRVLLFRMSEDLSKEDLDSLRFLYQKVPKKTVVDEGIDLFTVMIQRRDITESNLSLLTSSMENIRRNDLVEKIREYTESDVQEHLIEKFKSVDLQEAVQESGGFLTGEEKCYEDELETKPYDDDHNQYSPCLPYGSTCSESVSECYGPGLDIRGRFDQPMDDVEEGNINLPLGGISFRNDPESPQYNWSSAQAVANPASNGSQAALDSVPGAVFQDDLEDQFDSYDPIECYKMDANPRGICVIINNSVFYKDPKDNEAVELNKREGSDVDERHLTASFTRLKFNVEIWSNLTSQEIHERLKELSLRDHRSFDCFVCCVLSHGGNGYMFGKNGRKVSVSDMTGYFSAQGCSSLLGKPKLFFIACCRGKVHQRGIGHLAIPEFETDAPEKEPMELVANEADFLLGYATVSNYVSYRSKSKGTFYINELTQVLDKYAHRDDLHTLLTRVNNNVNERIYETRNEEGHHIYKQIPAPQHTLRKMLKFL